jgi:hypothetical protein
LNDAPTTRLNQKSKRDFIQETQQEDDELERDDEDDGDMDSDGGLGAMQTASPPKQPSPASSTTSSKRTSRKSTRSPNSYAPKLTETPTKIDRISENGWDKWLSSTARQAVFDAKPYAKGSRPIQHLYWAINPKHACALNLVKREEEFQKEAVSWGGIDKFARNFADKITKQSRKAKNKHINQLRNIFFKQGSPFLIARHVLEKDVDDDNGVAQPMKMLKFLDTLPTVQDLHSLLMSDKMHAHKDFYKHFVAALASGKLCRIKKQSEVVPLADFISVNYEAHFRLELWACLGKQG